MSKSRSGAYPTSIEDRQLSLFSEMTDASPVDNLETESINGSNGQSPPPRTQDPKTLEEISAHDGSDPVGTESAPAGDLRSPGIDGEPAVRTDSSSKDGLPN